MSKPTIKLIDLFTNANTTVPEITIAFLHVFGLDALTWEPEVVKKELEEVLEKEISERNLDKISVGTLLIYTNAVEIYPDVFEKVCLTAYNEYPDTDVWHGLTPEQLIEGVIDVHILLSRKLKPWQDVETYIKLCLHEYGFFEIPPALMGVMELEDAKIPHAVTEKTEHQDEKNATTLEYLTTILEQRLAKLEALQTIIFENTSIAKQTISDNVEPLSPNKE